MIQWLIPLALLIFFEVVADVFSKIWSLNRGFGLAALALTAYLLANTFWLFALKNGSGLGRGAVIFSVTTALAAVLLGLFFYHEKVTIHQMFGMVLGVVSLMFIFWE